MSYDSSMGRVLLDFSSETFDQLPEGVAAVARMGKTMWLVCGKGAGLDRLVEIAADRFGQRKQLPLDEIFGPSPGAANGADPRGLRPGGEMDVAGLAIDGQDGGPWALWLVGSHARARKAPEPEARSRKTALRRLAAIKRPGNRFFLGRLPLTAQPDGTFDIPTRQEMAEGPGPQTLAFNRKGSLIARLIADDPHFGPFAALPAQDNGLDVAGIAVRGDRVILGCRGPVIGGYAALVELALTGSGDGLEAHKIEKGRRYRKFFLPLDGLGTRSLLLDGEDMLVLAAPTMAVGVPARVYRWHGAMRHERSAVIPASDVELLGDLPANMDDDRPQAIERWHGADGRRSLLVVHDRPAPGRIDTVRKTITADVIGLDRAPVAGHAQSFTETPASSQVPGADQGRSFTVAEGVKVQYHPPGATLPETK